MRTGTHRTLAICQAAIGLLAVAAAAGDQVTFEDDTASRLVADPTVGALDTEEKDLAWGDVDLVVARKQPFNTTGRRTNVLFLNEDGVLVDRTADFAGESDVDGDLGFLTPTNDRDVLLVDLTGDGWLDAALALARPWRPEERSGLSAP